jgi:hypothetical protein
VLGIKSGEPGFDFILGVVFAVGRSIAALGIWAEWRLNRRHAREHGDSRFSWVQLLVIVAIIATLICVLLPSLRRARDLGHEHAASRDAGSRIRQKEVSTMGAITYQRVTPAEVDGDELLKFYQRQQHAITRSPERIREMISRSHCFVTARDGDRLIGLARGVSDGVRGYLSECKLDAEYQGPAAVTRTDGRIEHDEHGIACELAQRVLESLRDAGVERIDVTAHGTEEDFCFDLGFRKVRGMVAMQLDPSVLAACPAQA